MAALSRIALVFAAIASTFFVSAARAATSAPSTQLAPDPALRTGVLSNGMRYMIMRNATPKGQAALRLRIGAGSMWESDDQQGLAHMLEHMAFKGSTHVGANEMVKILQRKGLAFGPDTNAATSWDETVYQLDLPETDKDTIDTGLMLMRETASEITVAPDALESERGVVLSEERTRDSPAYRAFKAKFQAQLDGQLASRRMPIGTDEVIKSAPSKRVLDFYRGTYRPENATLIVVGDFDPADMESKIRARFADWAAVGAATPLPDFGTVKPRPPKSQLLIIPGAPNTISLTFLKPYDTSPDTLERRRRELVEALVLAVLNRRLETLSRGAHPPFIKADAGDEGLVKSARIVGAEATTSPEGWRPGLSALIREIRRMAQYGVLPDELNREVIDTRTSLANAVAGASTRKTSDLANDLAQSVNDDRVFDSPASTLSLFDSAIAGLTMETVNRAAAGLLSGAGPLLQMNAPAPIEGGEKTLADAFSQAMSETVPPPAVAAKVAWPYVKFGLKPGRVVSRHTLHDLRATQVRFANGVSLTVKPTTFKADEILVQVRIGSGRGALPARQSNTLWASQAFTLGGLKRLSQEDVERALNGRTYDVQFGVSDEALEFQGATKRTDLIVQMQTIAAYVTEPGWRAEAFERLRASMSASLPEMAATAGGVLSRDLQWLFTDKDDRFRYPDDAAVAKAKLADLRALIDPTLKSAPIDITVVGDVTSEQAIAAVRDTFGALPRRASNKPKAIQGVRFPSSSPEPVMLKHNGRSDQALALIAWPTLGMYQDLKRARAVNVLQDIIQNRLVDEVRVAQGATYSPQGESRSSEVYPGYGVLMDFVETPPSKVDSFFTAANHITADLRDHPPTSDELARALNPRLERIIKAQQTNGYWVGRLSGSIADPKRLDLIRTTLPDYRKVTALDVQRAAQAYLTPRTEWRLVITSSTPPAVEPKSTPPAK